MRNTLTAHEKQRFEDKIYYALDSCWYWTASLTSQGYGQFNFRGRPQTASRISYMLYKGKIPKGFFICHHCDNRLCVNPSHLYAGTPADNMRDRNTRGRANMPFGEGHCRAVLTTQQVIEIRNSNLSKRKLAAIYGVGSTTIQYIKNNYSWKHLVGQTIIHSAGKEYSFAEYKLAKPKRS